jgi:NitT/TauT family transport system substrate-binding protein
MTAEKTPRKGLLLRSRTTEIVLALGLAAAIAAGAVAASSAASRGQQAAADSDGATAPSTAAELRLGYFGNVTHAPALVGVDRGFFAETLGTTKLSTQVFNAGPAAVEALNAGAIDAAFVGPNPAINSFVQSGGESVRIVAGATSGGAQLVVREGIDTPEDLRGRTLTTPQLGGTQDVALRVWLQEQGLETSTAGSGDVTVNPTENAQTLQLFLDGKIDGAWVPEPWASRLVLEGGAKVLVDEKDLWPDGDFTTTLLIVNNEFLDNHPEQVKDLVEGERRSVEWLNSTLETNKGEAAAAINAGLEAAHGKALAEGVIDRSLANIRFTQDPHATVLAQLLEDGATAGTTQEADLAGILDLSLLNQVLAETGEDPLSTAGLGTE